MTNATKIPSMHWHTYIHICKQIANDYSKRTTKKKKKKKKKTKKIIKPKQF